MKTATRDEIAGMIDHAVLKPEATDADVAAGCAVAVQYRTASLCVRPSDLPLATAELRGSGVTLSTVIGFPHGGDTTAAKLAAAEDALKLGAVELDVVLNIGKLRSGESVYVLEELRRLTALAHGENAWIKVIFENCFLTDAQKKEACRLSAEAGADWVKTSTGFGTGGATYADVRLMRHHSPARMQVKASGGIKTLEQVLEFRRLGCSRIGTSATAAILNSL